MERLIEDVFNYIDEAIRCALMDPAATLLVFMLLIFVIITPGRKAADRLLMLYLSDIDLQRAFENCV